MKKNLDKNVMYELRYKIVCYTIVFFLIQARISIFIVYIP